MTLKTRPIDQVPPLRLMLPLPLPLRALRRLARGAAALGIVGLLLGGCVVAPAQTADGYPYPGAGEATSTYPAGGQAAQAVDPPGRVGRLSQLQGTVWVREAGEREWSAARRNRPLTQGDSLHTERGARAELQIGSSTLRLDGDSRLEVLRLDDAQVQLGLDAGALALRTRAPEVAREFSIETDAGSFQPLQPGHVRIDARRQSTLAGVWSGSLRSKVSDVRFISHGISPSGIFSNDRFGTTGSDSRRRVVCGRLKSAAHSSSTPPDFPGACGWQFRSLA